MASGTKVKDDCFMPGDTWNFDPLNSNTSVVVMPGMIRNSRKTCGFMFPLPKAVSPLVSASVEITSMDAFIWGKNGNITPSGQFVGMSGITSLYGIVTPWSNLMMIVLERSSAFSNAIDGSSVVLVIRTINLKFNAAS